MKQLKPAPQSDESIEVQVSRIRVVVEDLSQKLGDTIEELERKRQEWVLRAKATKDDLNAALGAVTKSASVGDLVLTPPFPAGPLIPPTKIPFQSLWSTQFQSPDLVDCHFRILHAMKLYLKKLGAPHNFLNSERGIATHTLLWAERFCRLNIPNAITLSLATRIEVVSQVWESLFRTRSASLDAHTKELTYAMTQISVSHEAKNGYKLDDFDVFAAHKLLEDPLPNGCNSGRRRAKTWIQKNASTAEKSHMESFMAMPDGDWIILGLLFFRLLHLKLGLHLRSQVRPTSALMMHFYPGLMVILNQCAFDATHPLAPTAGGLALALRRFVGFYAVDDMIDPRASTLPYEFQLDSLSSTQLSCDTTRNWLIYLKMDYAIPWVDDVLQLAQDLASIYTDPYGQLAFKPNDPKEMLKAHCESLADFGRTLYKVNSGNVTKLRVPRVVSNISHPDYFGIMQKLLNHAQNIQAPLLWVLNHGLDGPYGYHSAR